MRDCACNEFVDLGTQEAICLGVDKIIMVIKGISKVEASLRGQSIGRYP